MKKKWVTWIIILAVIILSIIILTRPKTQTSEGIAKCIGQNSELYVQLGCHACETQEQMFGDNYQYLNSIDCFFEKEKCTEITHTPTWIIKGETHIGTQSIEKLKELTNC
tara:strand:+ start:57 stop:386 length:330 start_codon:yes stop_codon:yes gene_type:complete